MRFYKRNVTYLDGFVHNILIDQTCVINTVIRWQEIFPWSIMAVHNAINATVL